MSKVSDAKVPEGDRTEDVSQKKLKPCCACPETKKVRDEWWVALVVEAGGCAGEVAVTVSTRTVYVKLSVNLYYNVANSDERQLSNIVSVTSTHRVI